MNNVAQHLLHQPILSIVFIVALVLMVISLRHFMKQRRLRGSMFEFTSLPRKIIAGVSSLLLISLVVYSLTPYTSPQGTAIAIVLGNTQNTPSPTISPEASDAIIEAMLRHKGQAIDGMIDSIKIISAVKHPKVINLDSSDMQLQRIGNNSSNAMRSSRANISLIERKLGTLRPEDNGANYLEAILEATDNVKQGSKIIVIGSGLSDSGDLNFSKFSLLTNEESRKRALQKIQEKYGSGFLKGYEVEFYGLGDTVKPQEPLSNIQKGVVRATYEDVVLNLGGKATINTKTQVGPSTESRYVVGTTDTGCGTINLVFDDEDLKFIGNQAGFVDRSAAIGNLTTIKSTWTKHKNVIDSIEIDGYTAHYPGAGDLSQKRANTVKQALLDLGIPPSKVIARGKGYGPHKDDAKNRMVKVNINRSSNQCSN